jgi:hypothetical protein
MGKLIVSAFNFSFASPLDPRWIPHGLPHLIPLSDPARIPRSHAAHQGAERLFQMGIGHDGGIGREQHDLIPPDRDPLDRSRDETKILANLYSGDRIG